MRRFPSLLTWAHLHYLSSSRKIPHIPHSWLNSFPPPFLAQNLCSMKNVWDVWVMMVNSLLIPQWSRDHFSPHWLWLWGIIIMHHIIVAVSEWVHPSLWRSGAYWECLIKMDQDNTGYCYKRIITRHLGICGGKCYLNLLKLYFVLQSLFFHDYTILLYFYIVNVFVTNNEVNLLYSKTIWTFCQFNVG